MKNLAKYLLVLAILALGATAYAGLVLPTFQASKVNCPADGTTAPTLTLDNDAIRYYVTAEGETTYYCQATTCPTGGVVVFVGQPIIVDITATKTIACRSAGSSGILKFNSASGTP